MPSQSKCAIAPLDRHPDPAYAAGYSGDRAGALGVLECAMLSLSVQPSRTLLVHSVLDCLLRRHRFTLHPRALVGFLIQLGAH